KLRNAAFGCRQQVAGAGFVLGPTLLELGDIVGRGRNGAAVRHQEVAAIARLDVDLVAQVAEVGHFLQKNQFHWNSRSLAAVMAAAARGLSDGSGATDESVAGIS